MTEYNREIGPVREIRAEKLPKQEMLDLSTERCLLGEESREKQPRNKNMCGGPGMAGLRTEWQRESGDNGQHEVGGREGPGSSGLWAT